MQWTLHNRGRGRGKFSCEHQGLGDEGSTGGRQKQECKETLPQPAATHDQYQQPSWYIQGTARTAVASASPNTHQEIEGPKLSPSAGIQSDRTNGEEVRDWPARVT